MAKKTISNKILNDRVYEIAINPEYNCYKRGLESMVNKLFDKKTVGVESKWRTCSRINKSVIKKIKRRRAYARFKDKIWAGDLAEIGSLPSKNRGVTYFLSVILVFIKYVWVKTLKVTKGKTFIHGIIEIVNKSIRKPNKTMGWLSKRTLQQLYAKMVIWYFNILDSLLRGLQELWRVKPIKNDSWWK